MLATTEPLGGRSAPRKPRSNFEQAQAALGPAGGAVETPQKVSVPDSVRRAAGLEPMPPLAAAPAKVGGLDVVLERAVQKADAEAQARRQAELDAFPDILPVGQFMATEYPKPVELVEGLIFENTKTVLASASKAGKTWLAGDLALCVASGQDFLGRRVNRGRVLFINPEVSEHFYQMRLAMLAQEREIDLAKLADDYCVLNLRGRLPTGTEKGEGLTKTLSLIAGKIEGLGGEPFKFVLFDSFYKLLDILDENSNTDMRQAYNLVDSFLAGIGSPASLQVFHYGKGCQAEKDDCDRIVGAGVVGRDYDTVINLTAHKKKNLGYQILSVTSRNLEKPDSVVIQFKAPLWRIVEGEDASEFYTPKAGRTQTYSDSVLQAPIIGEENAKTPGEWLSALVTSGKGISSAQLRERRKTWGSALRPTVDGKRYWVDEDILNRQEMAKSDAYTKAKRAIGGDE